MRGNQRNGRQNYNAEMDSGEALEIKAMREVGVGQMIGNLDIITEGDNRSASNSCSRSGSRASTNRDRIRCVECPEYDHFVQETAQQCKQTER